MLVQVSAQYGGSKVDGIFWPLQKKMNESLSKYLVGGYFKSISKVAIVLRVSGEIWKFFPAGPGELKYKKKSNTITIDLVLLENQWKGVDLKEVAGTLVEGVRNSFRLMIEKSKEVGELENESRLVEDVEVALKDFLASCKC